MALPAVFRRFLTLLCNNLFSVVDEDKATAAVRQAQAHRFRIQSSAGERPGTFSSDSFPKGDIQQGKPPFQKHSKIGVLKSRFNYILYYIIEIPVCQVEWQKIFSVLGKQNGAFTTLIFLNIVNPFEYLFPAPASIFLSAAACDTLF